MNLYEDFSCRVSQGFFSGWKIENKISSAIMVPDKLLKERIGYVWIQVRKTKKNKSINSNFSEQVMFSSFAQAVMEPHSKTGEFWALNSPDQIADLLIQGANEIFTSQQMS